MTTSTSPPTEQERHAELRAQLEQRYGLTCIPRWGTLRNPERKTYGAAVARIGAALGTPLMPWQRYVADVALEVDPYTGLLFYRGVDLLVPRQSGKTSLILAVAVHRARAWQRQRIVYTAQSGIAARKKWEDEHLVLLAASKLAGQYRVRKAAGREAIMWTKTGSMHGLLAGTEDAGHGDTLNLALLDEYFAQIDGRADAAVGPAMITVDGAQKWRFSTAGTSKSIPLNTMRERGRAVVEATGGRPQPGQKAFFDWCWPDGARRDDPAMWRLSMPALCPAPVRGVCRCSREWRHTVTETNVRAELEGTDDLADFDRAYGNQTRDLSEVVVDPNVPTTEQWKLLGVYAGKGGKRLACGVDINPGRNWASIVAVGEGPNGKPLLKVLRHEPIGPGNNDWLLNDILMFNEQLQPLAWAVDAASPAGTLITPLANAQKKITRIRTETPHRGGLWVPSMQEYAAACAGFGDVVRIGGIEHTGQEAMLAAIGGLRSRPLGDGAFGWGRRAGAPDITPVVGGTLALAAYERWRHLDDDYDVMDSIY